MEKKIKNKQIKIKNNYNVMQQIYKICNRKQNNKQVNIIIQSVIYFVIEVLLLKKINRCRYCIWIKKYKKKIK